MPTTLYGLIPTSQLDPAAPPSGPTTLTGALIGTTGNFTDVPPDGYRYVKMSVSDSVLTVLAYIAPTVLTAASITPASGTVGTDYTITEATFDGYPTPTVTGVLTLDGVDVTADIVGGVYTSDTIGTLSFTSSAYNGVSPNASSTDTATVLAVPVAPSVNTPASISPSSGAAGTHFTLTEATFNGDAPMIVTFTLFLNAVDVSGDVVAGVYTSTAAGTLTFTCTGSNGVSPDATSTDAVTISAAATVPDAFGNLDWLLADSPSAGGDKLSATLGTLPYNGGSALTALQYRIGVGAAQTFSGLGVGMRLITVLAGAAANVEVRAVNAIGPGPWSAIKTATPTVSAAKPYVTREDEIIAFHNLSSAPDLEGFVGWTSETGFTVYTETTPDAVRSRIETWRATGTGKIKIKCDWDGIINLTTNSIRGPNAVNLTADAAQPSGYARPAGGVWITAAAGRTPVFGSTNTSAGFDVIGMPRLFLENLGFSTRYNNTATRNIWIRQTSTQPIWPVVAIKGCNIGGLTHRPADTVSQYARGVDGGPAYLVHIEDTKFFGCRQQFTVTGLFQRSWNNHFKKCVGDIHQHMGHTDAAYTGKRTSAWIEGCIVSDVIDDAAYPGLHTDFFQYTFAGDKRARGSYIIRYNVTHQLNTLAMDAGTQFCFGRWYASSAEKHDLVVHDNIVAISAYWALSFWDATGDGDCYIMDNTFVRAGGTYTNNDSWPAIQIDNATAAPGSGTGVIHVQNNIYAKTTDVNAAIQVSAGNFFVSPQQAVVSGNGLTQAAAKRHEDVFLGAVSRNGGDFMTYTITGEAAATDRQHALWAIADHFEPIDGWGTYGAPNPATWPTSPAHP